MVAIFKSVVKKGYSDNWKIYECYKKQAKTVSQWTVLWDHTTASRLAGMEE